MYTNTTSIKQPKTISESTAISRVVHTYAQHRRHSTVQRLHDAIVDVFDSEVLGTLLDAIFGQVT
jgi:hypothetical protein